VPLFLSVSWMISVEPWFSIRRPDSTGEVSHAREVEGRRAPARGSKGQTPRGLTLLDYADESALSAEPDSSRCPLRTLRNPPARP
jgi:hypothetical protein